MRFSINHLQRYCICGMLFVGVLIVLFGCRNITRKEAMTREEAMAFGLDVLPLPKSAANIFYYAEIDGLQSLQSFLRLDVNATELDYAVDAIITNNNAQFNRDLTYMRGDLSAGDYALWIVEEAKLDWWKPKNIMQGYFRGELKSYAVQMWIDEENSRIYVHQSD